MSKCITISNQCLWIDKVIICIIYDVNGTPLVLVITDSTQMLAITWVAVVYRVGIPADQNGGAQPISEILYIENQIDAV